MIKIRFLKSYKPYLVFLVVFLLNLLLVNLFGKVFGLIFRPFFPGDEFKFRYLIFTIFNLSFLITWLIISKLDGFSFYFLFDEKRVKRILNEPLIYVIGILNLYLYCKYLGKYIYTPFDSIIDSLNVKDLLWFTEDFYKFLYLMEAISFTVFIFILLIEGMNILTYTKGGNILIYFIVTLAIVMVILVIAMCLLASYKLLMFCIERGLG